MLSAVVAQGIAEFQDVTVEQGYFTPEQAIAIDATQSRSGLPVRVHADAWASSQGWRTAVEGGAVSAEHLTYTPDEEISDVGRTDTIAVILPMAELVYMTSERANARLFIETRGSGRHRHRLLLVNPCHVAAQHLATLRRHGFAMTPGGGHRRRHAQRRVQPRPAVGVRLARRRKARRPRSSSTAPHPDEICLAVGAPLLDQVVIAGRSWSVEQP